MIATVSCAGFVWWSAVLPVRQYTDHGATRGAAPLMSLICSAIASLRWARWSPFIYGTALFGLTYLLPVFMQRGLVLAPCRHHPAAGRIHSGRHHCAGRAAGRSPARAPLVSVGLLLLASSLR